MQLANIHSNKIQTTFPYIKDKMVIDFINGLDTAKHLNQQNHAVSQDFIKRNLALISGKQQMAQSNINDHLIAGLEACQAYFAEISYHQQAHANAIIKLKQTLDQTQIHVTEIAYYVSDLQNQANQLQAELSQANRRIDQLEQSEKAKAQLEGLLSAWQAERFSQLSPMGQCFLVLDTLSWGDYGLYVRQLDNNERQQQLDTLRNKIINVQKALLKCGANDDLLKQDWLKPTHRGTAQQELQAALQYQGDWSWQNPQRFAMAFTATQFPSLSSQQAARYNDLVISMIDINRVSQRMINNVFAA
ncbi:Uncharacterised protein [Moraxella atlantae]|uniref:Uncharacterized protein n=2 Tax=Faucicola atlantae TaxID=34059 RepID=A0A378Q5J5_9GAMM|nr:hypothetical protein B5J92_08475 [Moraxella atlantae]STY94457.1 Uncharacterised protein [Moraxella atlantae]